MTTVEMMKMDNDAFPPLRASTGAAAWDLHALGNVATSLSDSRVVYVRTGWAFAVPSGYVMLLFSRSGDGFNRSVRLANCVGVIDSDYRGEVMVALRSDSGEDGPPVIRKGDRVAQMMFVKLPDIQLAMVGELPPTERGAGGFGSTGGHAGGLDADGNYPVKEETLSLGGVSVLDPVLRPEDLSIEFAYRPGQPVSGFAATAPRGIKITHNPTGAFAQCTHHRSQHMNRDCAIRGLREMLRGDSDLT